ncbi:unnamed protein product [Periconia digitata]|uniref:Low temperature requirement A n=1 Tax=Periconia digitata TaxID=1303443 RepID=A0A9W4UG10_9PLEO|nr:unnamed protein product [Periconia digitata]
MAHHVEERRSLRLFASPLHEHSDTILENAPAHHHHGSLDQKPLRPQHHHHSSSSDVESFDHVEYPEHHRPDQHPTFHRHAEATTAELFYDLFFVANLTTFTSIIEINDQDSLTSYVGFFSLLWLTWYQVSLYDVRFSADSVFERVAKSIHFGIMVGFAVIGPQWHPGQSIADFKVYRTFSIALAVSRLTLTVQYSVTLMYTKKYKKTVLPLSLVIVFTALAAVLYGGLYTAFPQMKFDETGEAILQKSNVYIAWYVIAILETLLTVAVSCVWRVISFKGTHLVQRMSLLTLIILGEGIIVICKAISEIVKNDFLWSSAVIGQIIGAVLVIYFLYMLYFDRLHEEHFGSIKQQIWSFNHFPLHVVLVLVLQGISLLIIWTQAMQLMTQLYSSVDDVEASKFSNGTEFANFLNQTVFNQTFGVAPKGVDTSKTIKDSNTALSQITEAYDFLAIDQTNETAKAEYIDGMNDLMSAATTTLFDSLKVSISEHRMEKLKNSGVRIDFQAVFDQYTKFFGLVVSYVFISGGLSLVVMAILGFLSLPPSQRINSQYVRLGINALCGFGLTFVAAVKYNPSLKAKYMSSSWMIPTILLVYFYCVVVNLVSRPRKMKKR